MVIKNDTQNLCPFCKDGEKVLQPNSGQLWQCNNCLMFGDDNEPMNELVYYGDKLAKHDSFGFYKSIESNHCYNLNKTTSSDRSSNDELSLFNDIANLPDYKFSDGEHVIAVTLKQEEPILAGRMIVRDTCVEHYKIRRRPERLDDWVIRLKVIIENNAYVPSLILKIDRDSKFTSNKRQKEIQGLRVSEDCMSLVIQWNNDKPKYLYTSYYCFDSYYHSANYKTTEDYLVWALNFKVKTSRFAPVSERDIVLAVPAASPISVHIAAVERIKATYFGRSLALEDILDTSKTKLYKAKMPSL